MSRLSAIPDYVTELAPLTTELRQAHGSEWNWDRGGCFAFAEAYVLLFGGSLYGICRFDRSSNDYPVDHAIVRLSASLYIDACGEVSLMDLGGDKHLLSRDDEKIA